MSEIRETNNLSAAISEIKDFAIVYFQTENCTEEENRVVGAGGSVMKSRMSIGQYGFITLATDTEGNVFGLHSRK